MKEYSKHSRMWIFYCDDCGIEYTPRNRQGQNAICPTCRKAHEKDYQKQYHNAYYQKQKQNLPIF
jgi:uncharacterized paraquat-inducible protein A